MKKVTFVSFVSAILLFVAVVPASAQEENGFKKFQVEEGFEDNGFQWFRDAELLCAGDKEKSNAMTIGWGGIGTLWGTYCPDGICGRKTLHQGIHGQGRVLHRDGFRCGA